MTISVVLRLTVPALREGRLAGQVEIVEDGMRLVVRDAQELVDAMSRYVSTGSRSTAMPDQARDLRSEG